MNFIYSTAFSYVVYIIKGFLYALILFYASYSDAKTKTIPDKVHLLLFLFGLINVSVHSIIGVLVAIPFLITALISGGIGGGDIKFMAANGFVLGLSRGFAGSIIGLLIAVIVNPIYYRIKNRDKNISFPLAPYLSIGCFLLYLI